MATIEEILANADRRGYGNTGVTSVFNPNSMAAMVGRSNWLPENITEETETIYPESNDLDANWDLQLRMQDTDQGNTGFLGNLWEGTKNIAGKFSPVGILNTLTGRKGATESIRGYPGGWESRAGLFPNEVTNLQRLADKGYLAGGGKDIFGTNVVSAFGDYDKAMANQLVVFEKTMGKKGYQDLDELENYYLDRYGKDSRLYKKLQHVRGWNKPVDKPVADKIITPNNITNQTGGGYDPNVHGPTNYGRGSDGQQSYDFGQGFGWSATGSGPVSNRTGRGRTDWAQGGRIGLRMGGDPTQWMSEQETITPFQLQQEEGVNMGLEASAPDPMDALNDMSMEIFGKPLNLLNEDEFQMLIDMANDQAMGIGNEQGIASLV